MIKLRELEDMFTRKCILVLPWSRVRTGREDRWSRDITAGGVKGFERVVRRGAKGWLSRETRLKLESRLKDETRVVNGEHCCAVSAGSRQTRGFEICWEEDGTGFPRDPGTILGCGEESWSGTLVGLQAEQPLSHRNPPPSNITASLVS